MDTKLSKIWYLLKIHSTNGMHCFIHSDAILTGRYHRRHLTIVIFIAHIWKLKVTSEKNVYFRCKTMENLDKLCTERFLYLSSTQSNAFREMSYFRCKWTRDITNTPKRSSATYLRFSGRFNSQVQCQRWSSCSHCLMHHFTLHLVLRLLCYTISEYSLTGKWFKENMPLWFTHCPRWKNGAICRMVNASAIQRRNSCFASAHKVSVVWMSRMGWVGYVIYHLMVSNIKDM